MRTATLTFLSLLFLIACQVITEPPTTVTGSVVLEMKNDTNTTPVQVTVQSEVKEDNRSVADQQRQLFQSYVQVKKKIRGLTKELKQKSKREGLKEELIQAYKEEEYLEGRIRELDQQSMANRIQLRTQKELEETNNTLEKFKQEELAVKAKIGENRFKIDKLREVLQQTTDQGKRDSLKEEIVELEKDQEVFKDRLNKVYERIFEQEQNIQELLGERFAREEEEANNEEKQLIEANLVVIERLIRERELDLEKTVDGKTKTNILAELNDLAVQRGNLKEALEGIERKENS